jgi:hypothetical protein
MSSDSREAALEVEKRAAGIAYGLLDPAFGFAVWAVHLVIVYGCSAVACQVGLGSRGANMQSRVVIMLIAFTPVAAGVVALHAVRRHRKRRDADDRGFLARLAVGHDAVAIVAILWQLMPVTMVPLCR